MARARMTQAQLDALRGGDAPKPKKKRKKDRPGYDGVTFGPCSGKVTSAGKCPLCGYVADCAATGTHGGEAIRAASAARDALLQAHMDDLHGGSDDC